jgi:hypothetical protein
VLSTQLGASTYWFNPSIAHQSCCRSEPILRGLTRLRAKYVPNIPRTMFAGNVQSLGMCRASAHLTIQESPDLIDQGREIIGTRRNTGGPLGWACRYIS